MLGETSSCPEVGKQEQHPDYVLERLPTEVSASNDHVGTKYYANEVEEGRVEAANYVEDQKIQDLPQDVTNVIDSESSAKNCGDVSAFQNIEMTGHQVHNVENVRGMDSEEVVAVQGKNSDVGLEETSNITLKHIVPEQLENPKENPKCLEQVGGQPSLEMENRSAINSFPSEAVAGHSNDVSASGSHTENAKPNQTDGSFYVQNHDALPISTGNELSPHAASLNKEEVPLVGIEIPPERRQCVLALQQLEIPDQVISDNPRKILGRSGRRYKKIAKVKKRKYTLRSLSSDRSLNSKSVDNAKNVDMENETANATTTEVKKRGRKKNSEKNVASNEYSRIRKNLSYMLNRIRYEQSLIDAYSSEGWKGLSLEKLKPDKEIERAKSEIVRRKLKIRDLFQHLDSLCLEGKLSEDLFDSEGMIDSEDIFCAKCRSKDLTLDNDIILCDGFCERGFHQFCLEPPLPKEDIPPDNEGWLCPGCDCKVECVDLLNESEGTKLSINDSWEKVFPESVKSGHLDPNSGLSTDDSEDDDYDPEKPQNDDDDEGNESGSGGSEYATASEKSNGGPSKDNNQDPGLSSDDSEDDDFDPDAPDYDKVKEESSSSDFSSDSEDLTATLVDEGPVVGKKRNLDDESLMESDTGESGASPITAKRHVPRLDYKKLHDEEYGGTSSEESSDDEEWTDAIGTRKRKQQDRPEASAKKRRVEQHSVTTNASVGSQMNDSPKSNSAGAKGQSSHPKRVLRKEAKERLQVAFTTNHFPDRAAKESLAQELGITYQQVDKWFGNARWFLNHPSGRKINVSGKAAKSTDPVPETIRTVGNTDSATACSNGRDQSAVKPETSSVSRRKIEEKSPKSNKKNSRRHKSK